MSKSSTKNAERVGHTPGPWTIHWTEHFYTILPVTNNEEIRNANARLIAAAPELLEACESFIKAAKRMSRRDSSIVELSESFTAAEAAIAKARGQ